MHKFLFTALAAVITLPIVAAAQAPAADAGAALIPRSALFGNPQKAQARISPDAAFSVLDWTSSSSSLSSLAASERWKDRSSELSCSI